MSTGGRVLLRARSGPRIGMGHVMRTRAVAEEVLARGGEALLVVNDETSAERLRREGFEALSVAARPGWASEPARGAWIDGFVDWSPELRALLRRGTPSYLVENRTRCRELAGFVVQPKLFVDDDLWERVNAARILRGPSWIPLSRALLAQAPAEARDLELLITFGGSDPLASTERVLGALPRGMRVAVAIGAHMQERRAAIAAAAGHLEAELLPVHAPLAPWMARARAAVTAVGTTLFELAYLRTPALVLGNWEEDRAVLDFYRARGPFLPLGLASELEPCALARALRKTLAGIDGPALPVEGLGDGAGRLAERLLDVGRVALAA